MDPEPRRLNVASPSRIAVALACALALASALAPAHLAAQAQPDSVRADTLRVDTLQVDTLQVDTLPPMMRPEPDTLPPGDSVEADTIFYNLPRVDHRPANGWTSGAWSWNHDEILATGAITLLDLLEKVPGVIALRAGDYGTPHALTAFALGAGRIRVFRDGFELVPLVGGSVELARVGLGGITHVRLERMPDEIRIYLESFTFADGRAYSLVEAGTGDLNTNLLRGMFGNPTALGGDVALALERADSRGARGNEQGFVQGTWVRYQLHRGDAAGIAVDYRRMASQTDAPYVGDATRSDLTVRGRVALPGGFTAAAYWGRSSYSIEDDSAAYYTEGGRRSQLGVRASWALGGFFADGAYRHFGGDDGLPSDRVDVSLGADLPRVGGFVADLDRATWEGEAVTARRVRGWTRPLLGFSAFGSWASGTYGARTYPMLEAALPEQPSDTTVVTVPPSPPPYHRFTERTTSRYGVQWAMAGVVLSGAKLWVEADSLLPIGIEPDRSGPAIAAGSGHQGWEATASLPLPILRGLHVEGSYQEWSRPWTYLPERIYRGTAVFHRTFLESENFEMWLNVGVVGHDPMTTRELVQDPEGEEGAMIYGTVPFYQSWYTRLQLRIVTVRIFLGWDNFAIRRDLQNFPGRLLPITRAFYGIRWTMWN